METVWVVAGIILVVVLMFKRWFWLITLGTGCVTAALRLMTSLAHFQVVLAMGYMIAMVVCWIVAREIADGYPPSDESETHQDTFKHDKESPDWSPH